MTHASGTGKYEQMLVRCQGLNPIPTAVAHPCEETALAGALEAAEKGLIIPFLVGPAARIQEIAAAHGTHPPRRPSSWSARARPSCS
jgi:phosphate acetyltransferase